MLKVEKRSVLGEVTDGKDNKLLARYLQVKNTIIVSYMHS